MLAHAVIHRQRREGLTGDGNELRLNIRVRSRRGGRGAKGTHKGNERNVGIKSWATGSQVVGVKTKAANNEGDEKERP